jgi:hypothetical protein
VAKALEGMMSEIQTLRGRLDEITDGGAKTDPRGDDPRVGDAL